MTIVNLNKTRKARTKSKKRAQANENAVKFGRSKVERAQEAATTAREKAKLDGHKRDIETEN